MLDRKGVTSTICEMFQDDMEELLDFFRVKVNEEKKEEEIRVQAERNEKREENSERLQNYINIIRRVRASRVNKRRSNPMMMGRILRRSSNKKKCLLLIQEQV